MNVSRILSVLLLWPLAVMADDRASPSPELIARGAYLAKAADCAGCHTAPSNGAPYAGGLEMTSPFGTIVSSNITPDRETGIGTYSYEDFAKALREGVAPGGKGLYPAMPYPAFVKISDDDLRALYAYMMHGVPPVNHRPPETKVPFPFNQRWALPLWRMAFAPKQRFEPHADRDASWNRGAYLVQSLGHCGSCHTPRGIAYQERGYDESSKTFLSGGVNDNWFAPNLRGDSGSGLGRIAQDDIAAFLKTGHGAGMAAFGSMVETIEDSTQYLTDDDLRSIAVYLKTLPATGAADGVFDPSLASPGRLKTRAPDVAPEQGAAVYAGFCAQCHRSDGKGVPNAFPALAGNPSVISEDTTSLIRLLVEGGNSPATIHGPPRQAMPPFAGRLTDVQIAQVLTYVRASWGNDARPVTANDVGSFRATIHK
ncbi:MULTISPECIES: c-type cytochrome [Caballeronia]|jgi:alcohol dehydrogenase (quinone), cytochrome c subunit|uniref:Alcohol dehydrogenase n=2 Tax=Caballeronia TaxID=1827195 RepID=A0A656QNR9_9BURK|nr:gluconate 2-dehydrogenase (acceptor) [Burkholderia sp. SJ98]KDR31887.1 alcohol dehydrogenase [Caballeronia zhejiangensis]